MFEFFADWRTYFVLVAAFFSGLADTPGTSWPKVIFGYVVGTTFHVGIALLVVLFVVHGWIFGVGVAGLSWVISILTDRVCLAAETISLHDTFFGKASSMYAGFTGVGERRARRPRQIEALAQLGHLLRAA